MLIPLRAVISSGQNEQYAECIGTPDELDPQKEKGIPFLFPHLPYTSRHIIGSPQEAPGGIFDALML